MAKRRPERRRSGSVIEIELTPDHGGVWLHIRSRQRLHYDIQYFALGTGGRQRNGSVRGNVTSNIVRRFVDLGFDVVVAGIIRQQLVLGPAGAIEVDAPAVPPREPSFRPMHPSLTSAARVRIPTARRRRRRSTTDTMELYGADQYGLYGDTYGQYFDQYGIYGDAYQDMYGPYFGGYGELTPYEEAPPAKRKRKPKVHPKKPGPKRKTKAKPGRKVRPQVRPKPKVKGKPSPKNKLKVGPGPKATRAGSKKLKRRTARRKSTRGQRR
jgi:hypothetical protein